mgnify:FL=1
MNRAAAVRQTTLTYANEKFEWGVIDCCMFCIEAAKKIEGVDFGDVFEHESEQDASEYIKEAGGLGPLVTKTMKRQPVPVNTLELGDPVLVNLPIIGHTLGIFVLDSVLCKTDAGTIKISLNRAIEGWKLNA